MPALLFFTTAAGYVSSVHDPDDAAGLPSLALIEARDRGESLSGLPVPTRFRLDTPRKTVPDAFTVYNGFRIVSSAFLAALDECDRGACEAVPIDLLAMRGERAFGDFFILQVRDFKDSIIEERTEAQIFDHKDFGRSLSIYPHLHGPQPMVLDRGALDGPDLWRERHEPFHVYASDRLLAACKARKLKGLRPSLVSVAED